MKLVIVESPHKAETISKYLGKDYVVKASKGHVRELSKHGIGGFGIDIDKGFIPSYEIIPAKYPLIKELKELVKDSDEVILASDPDREGEAIAWHLCEVLGLDENKTKRIEFHEITPDVIKDAIEHPRVINMNYIMSQSTRRMIDRILGFKLSYLMRKTIKSKSAGRVQSATLKFICDRELERNAFVPTPYWTLNAYININKDKIKLNYAGFAGKKLELNTEDNNKKVISALKDCAEITDIKVSNKKTESKLPFKTSTLQQEAFAKFGYSIKKTSDIIQELYEGVEVEGEHIGLITYIRTEGTAMSASFVKSATEFIGKSYGFNYLGNKKKIASITLGDDTTQGAHEAIRPTSVYRFPSKLKSSLSNEQYKVYKLIYDRSISALMAAKEFESASVSLKSGDVDFKFNSQKVTFDGYTKIYNASDDESEQTLDASLLKIGDKFSLFDIENEKKMTEPPERYTEGKIVKLMEEEGIGRPSTYAATIKVLYLRKYIESQKGYIVPTEQGMKTAHLLDKYFPEIVASSYTSDMEKELDDISNGLVNREEAMKNFYDYFMKVYAEGENKMYKDPDQLTGEVCPICGKPLVIKKSKYGPFVACSGFPKCNYVQKEEEELEEVGRECPECGEPLVYRHDKKGKKFIACSAYPDCKYSESIIEDTKTDKVCPQCGAPLIKKKGKYSYFYGCSNYPNCKYQEPIRKSKKLN